MESTVAMGRRQKRFTCPIVEHVLTTVTRLNPSQPREVTVGVLNRTLDNTNKDIWQGQTPEFRYQ